MKKQISQPYFFRTAYFIGWLKSKTGQSFPALEKRIRTSQYEKYKLTPPAFETVRDYFRLCRSPAIDPKDGKTPPWVMAAELEIPGASYAFFHPLFDLLIGQLQSSIKWSDKLQEIPEEWISSAIKRGNTVEAEEWISFNDGLKKSPGRKRKQPELVDIEFIHKTLIRLPEPIFSILFYCSEKESYNSTEMFARTYRPIEEEIALIQVNSNIDALAALVGLVLEAAEIGHLERFEKASKAVQGYLHVLDGLPECKSVRENLKPLIKDFCLGATVRTYASQAYYGYGLPATWRGWNANRHIESELRKIMFADNPDDIEGE